MFLRVSFSIIFSHTIPSISHDNRVWSSKNLDNNLNYKKHDKRFNLKKIILNFLQKIHTLIQNTNFKKSEKKMSYKNETKIKRFTSTQNTYSKNLKLSPNLYFQENEEQKTSKKMYHIPPRNVL